MFTVSTHRADNDNVLDQNNTVSVEIVPNQLTVTAISPDDRLFGATADYLFEFTLFNDLPATGRINVTFPTGYDISGLGVGGGECGGSTFDLEVHFKDDGDRMVVLHNTTGADCTTNPLNVTLTGIVNPPVGGVTAPFTIATTNSTDARIDLNEDATVRIIGDLMLPVLEASDDRAGASTPYTFSLGLVNTMPVDGHVNLTFPAGYTVSSPAVSVSDCNGNPYGLEVTWWDGATRKVELANATAPQVGCSGPLLNFTLTGITNPTVSGETDPFTVFTADEVSATLDINTTATATILPNELVVQTLSPDDDRAGVSTDYTFGLDLFNPLPAAGRVNVTFPEGFVIDGVGVGSAQCGGAAFDLMVVHESSADRTVTLHNATGASCSADPLEFTLTGVVNPVVSGVTGTFGINTTTSTDAVIDQTLTATVTVQPNDLAVNGIFAGTFVAGETTEYAFNFTLTNAWPSDGRLRVVFPSDHSFGAPAATATGCDGSYGVNLPGSNIVDIQRSGGTGCSGGTAVNLTLTDIHNPPRVGETDPFTIQTRTALPDAFIIDQNTTSTVQIVSAGTLTGVGITPTDARAGASADYEIDFTLATTWPEDGRLNITFPEGVDVSNVGAAATLSGCSGADGDLTVTVDAVQRTVEAVRSNAGDCDPADTLTVTFTGFTNPPVSGTHSPVLIYTQDGGGVDLDEGTGQLDLDPAGLDALSVTPDDRFVDSITDYTFVFTLSNPWPADGTFNVTFPAGYDVSGVSSGTISGCSGADGSFGAADIDAQMVVMQRTGGGACDGGDVMTVTVLGVQNPPARGETDPFTVATTIGAGTFIDQNTTATLTILSGVLADASVTLDDPVQGATGVTASVRFTLEDPWPEDGLFNITLGADFGVSGAGAGTLSGCTGGDGALNLDSTDPATGRVILERDGSGVQCAIGDTLTVTVTGLDNPPGPSGYGAYPTTVRVEEADGERIATASPDVVVHAGALSSVTVTPADATAGATGAYGFSFGLGTDWPNNGRLNITFPEGYSFGVVAIQTSSGCDGNYNLAGPTDRTFTVTRSGGTMCSVPATFSITLTQITNPGVSGTFSPFVLETMENDHTVLDAGEGSATIQPGSLSAESATPDDFKAGAIATYNLTFTLANDWPDDGALEVVLPSGFDVSGSLDADVTQCSAAAGGASASASGQTVTVVRDGAGGACDGGTTVSVEVSGVVNPAVSGLTDGFGLTTTNATGQAIDTGEADGVAIVPGDLTVTAVHPGDSVAGANTSYAFNVTTSNPWPEDGAFNVTFPSGYNVTGAAFGSLDGCSGASGDFTVSVDAAARNVSVSRDGNGDACDAGELNLTVTGIRNPMVSGLTGTFAVETQNAIGAVIDAGTGAGIQIDPGALAALSATPEDNRAGADGNHTFAFTLANPWPSNGKLTIAFPEGYTIGGAATADLVGGCTGAAGTLSAAVSDRNVTLTRSGGADCAGGDALTVNLTAVTNPSLSGTTGVFVLNTTTAADAVIDTGEAPGVAITAGVLASVVVTPDSLVAGATTTYAFNATLEQQWPADGNLTIAFPSGFDVSGAAAGTIDGCDGGISGTVDGQDVTLTRDGLGSACSSGQWFNVTVTGVVNPGVSGLTGGFTLETSTAAGVQLDLGTASGVTIEPGALTALSATADDSLMAGATTNYTFGFTTANDWPADGTLAIVFPGGFDLSGLNNTASTSGCVSGDFNVLSSGQTVTVTRSGGSDCGGAITVTLEDVVNPPVSGLTGDFTLTTTNATGQAIDTGEADGVTITPGALTVEGVHPADFSAGASTSYAFNVTTTNPWPGNGAFNVTFPSGYNVTDAAFGSVAGCSGTLGSFSVTVNTTARNVSVLRTGGGTVCDAGELNITVTGIRNPMVSGLTGTFAVETQNAIGAVIDEGTGAGITIEAAGLTGLAVAVANLTVAATDLYNFTFTLANPLPADGHLNVTFPADYTLGGAMAAELWGCSAANGTLTANVDGLHVNLSRGGGAGTCGSGETLHLNLTDVTNPPYVNTTGTFLIETRDNAFTLIDNGTVAGITTTPGLLTITSVTPESTVPGANTTYVFLFNTSTVWPSDGRLVVEFPSGYNLTWADAGAPLLDGDACVGSADVAVDVDNGIVVLTRTGGTDCAGPTTGIALNLTGIQNPPTIAVTGDFTLRTTLSAANWTDTIDEGEGGAVSIEGGTLTGVLAVADDLVAGATANYTFNFTLENTWDANGTLRIQFPSGYGLAGVAATNITGCAPGAGGNVTASTSGLVVTVQRADGGDCGGTSAMTVNLTGVVNPTSTGPTGTFGLFTVAENGIDVDNGTAAALTLTAGAPAQLVVTVQPTNALVNTTISPALSVEIRDTFGNVVDDGASYWVNASIKSGTGTSGAVLAGTVNASTATGNATYADLEIDTAGVGFLLHFNTTAGIFTVDSDAFNILSGTPTNVTAHNGPVFNGVAVTSTQLLQAKVLNATDAPVHGATVNWNVTAGDGSVSVATSITNAQGVAETTFTPDTTAGATNTIEASVDGVAGTVNFTVNTVAGPPTQIQAVSSTSITGVTAGSQVTGLTVRVRDVHNNVVEGATVQWTRISGSGTVSSSSTTTASNGQTSINFNTHTTPGTAEVRARLAVDPAKTVIFTITTEQGPATQIAVSGSASLTATTGGEVTLAARVRDANNVNVAGYAVSWTVTQGLGAVASSTTDTNAQGIASVTFTAGSTPGTVTVEGSGGGLTGSPVTYTITVNSPTVSGAATHASTRVVEETAEYTFNFTLTREWPSNGRIVITFPAGYSVASPTASATGCDGDWAATVADGRNVTVTRSGGNACASGTAVSLKVSGVTNRASAGSSGTFAGIVQDGTGQEIMRATFPAVTLLTLDQVTPPGAITDLAVQSNSATHDSVTLRWTAPGSMGTQGDAVSSYVVKRSTSPITAANFDAATTATATFSPATLVGPGLTQQATVTGLDLDTTYYFAVKARDAHNNVGAISNVVSESTLPDTTPPTGTLNIQVTVAGSAAVFSWDALTDPESSVFYHWAVNDDPDHVVTEEDERTTATTVTATDLEEATWHFHVRGFSAGGEGPQETLEFQIGEDALPAPPLLDLAQINENLQNTVTVRQTGDGMEISWNPSVLPDGAHGVQVWRMDSPAVHVQDVEQGTPEFEEGRIVDPDGTSDSVYFVTAYFGPGVADGYHADDLSLLPGYVGLTEQQMRDRGTSASDLDDEARVTWWIWLLIILLVLVVAGAVVGLVWWMRRQEDDPASLEGTAWDEEEEAPYASEAEGTEGYAWSDGPDGEPYPEDAPAGEAWEEVPEEDGGAPEAWQDIPDEGTAAPEQDEDLPWEDIDDEPERS